jgi:hypothetical protein
MMLRLLQSLNPCAVLLFGKTGREHTDQDLKCCSPRRIYDFLVVAPPVGVASTFLKGPVDPVRYVNARCHCALSQQKFKARYAEAQMQKNQSVYLLFGAN